MSLLLSKKTLIYAGLAVLLLCLGIAVILRWNSSTLPSPSPTPTPSSSATSSSVFIEVQEGAVYVRRPSQGSWMAVTASSSLFVGDSIKTETASKATIIWGSRGVTRLDSDTELVIEDMPTGEEMTKTVTKIGLTRGTIWSRFLKLLDAESSTTIRTNGVVATVRGTSFGVGTDGKETQLAVTDSVVEIMNEEHSTSTMLADDMWGLFDNAGKSKIVRYLTDQDEWPKQHRTLDTAYREFIEQQLKQRYQELKDMKEPVDCSERVQAEMEEASLAGFFGEIALEPLLRIEPSSCLKPEQAEQALKTVRLTLEVAMHKKDTDPLLLEVLGHFRGSLLRILIGSESTMFARLLLIDDSIDRLRRGDMRLKKHEIMADLDIMKGKRLISSKEEGKWKALRFRLLAERKQNNKTNVNSAAPSKQTTENTSPIDIPMPITEQISIVNQEPLVIEPEKNHPILHVTTNGPISLTTGQSVPLEASLIYPDGSKTYITYQCDWTTSDPKKATIQNANFFSVSEPGTVDAICTYTEQGILLKGALTFTIQLDPALLKPIGSKPIHQ